MMHFTVYRTTNTVNGRTYIGLHETQDLQDGYLGSGKAIRGAIKKYGRESFKKEILFVFDNREDMLAKERELVDCRDPNTYNIRSGGQQTPPESRICRKGQPCPQSTREALRIHNTGSKKPKWVGEKISASHKKRLATPEGKALMSRVAKIQWADPERRARNIADAKARLAHPDARRTMSRVAAESHALRNFWNQQGENTGSFHFAHRFPLTGTFLKMGRI